MYVESIHWHLYSRESIVVGYGMSNLEHGTSFRNAAERPGSDAKRGGMNEGGKRRRFLSPEWGAIKC